MSTTSARVPGERSPRLGRLQLPTGAKLQEYALAGVIVALLVVGAILKPDTFPTVDNFRAVLVQASVVGVLAIGMTFVIATAGIDLSVGSVVAAAGVFGGLLVDNGSVAFVVGALAFGLLLGTVNAVAIAFGKVVPFVATLAMLAIARGLALQMSEKRPISLLDLDGVRWFGTGEIVGVPASVVIFLAVTVAGWVLLNRTRYGRHVVAVGGNRKRRASPGSLCVGPSSASTASPASSPGSPRCCCAAGWPAPRPSRASSWSSTRSGPP